MFEVLPESGPQRVPASWGSRVFSLALHAAVIVAAIRLTDGAAQEPERIRPTDVIYTTPSDHPPRPTAPPPPTASTDPGPPAPPLVVPTIVPPDIPPAVDSLPIRVGTGIDSIARRGGDSLTVTGHPPVITAPIDAHVADEAPRLVDHPSLRYPEAMRVAGIEARVLVEAVLDTTGRVESGSVRALGDAPALFAAEARALVAGSRYRPARLAGHAVRVRIQVPVNFTLRR